MLMLTRHGPFAFDSQNRLVLKAQGTVAAGQAVGRDSCILLMGSINR